MAIKDELDGLLAKRMDRKEFIKHILFAVIASTGVGALIKTLSMMNGSEQKGKSLTAETASSRKSGYGRAGYGSKIEG